MKHWPHRTCRPLGGPLARNDGSGRKKAINTDAVIDLPASATPAECTDALRTQVEAVVTTDRLEPELIQHLRNIMTTLG